MHDFICLHLFISSSCVASKINDFIRLLVLIMVALCNRADHYIFALWFLSIFFFFFFFFLSSPNIGGRTLDVYHTSTHGVALVRI